MLTIHEMRERDAAKLAERLNPNPTPAEIETARHALRLFYIFAAAYYKAFLVHQDSDSQTERAAADERSEKTYKKAVEALKPYKLKIDLPGLYPVIEDYNNINFTFGHFYN